MTAATPAAAESKAVAVKSLSDRDEVNLLSGIVRRAVVDALLEPLAELRWDAQAREFLIRLLQVRCFLYARRRLGGGIVFVRAFFPMISSCECLSYFGKALLRGALEGESLRSSEGKNCEARLRLSFTETFCRWGNDSVVVPVVVT